MAITIVARYEVRGLNKWDGPQFDTREQAEEFIRQLPAFRAYIEERDFRPLEDSAGWGSEEILQTWSEFKKSNRDRERRRKRAESAGKEFRPRSRFRHVWLPKAKPIDFGNHRIVPVGTTPELAANPEYWRLLALEREVRSRA